MQDSAVAFRTCFPVSVLTTSNLNLISTVHVSFVTKARLLLCSGPPLGSTALLEHLYRGLQGSAWCVPFISQTFFPRFHLSTLAKLPPCGSRMCWHVLISPMFFVPWTLNAFPLRSPSLPSINLLNHQFSRVILSSTWNCLFYLHTSCSLSSTSVWIFPVVLITQYIILSNPYLLSPISSVRARNYTSFGHTTSGTCSLWRNGKKNLPRLWGFLFQLYWI